MNKIQTLFVIAAILAVAATQAVADKHHFYPLDVAIAEGKTEVTLFEVGPELDRLLKR